MDSTEPNFEELEDAEDVRAYDAAVEELGPNIPWDEVRATLGLD